MRLKRTFLPILVASALMLTACGNETSTGMGLASTSKTSTSISIIGGAPIYSGDDSTSSATAEASENEDLGDNSGMTDSVNRDHVFEYLSDINIGWNLGNTLDAHGAGNSLSAETRWGNPKASKELIQAVNDQGFNAIRIPVTWAEHLGPAPDYKIDEEWLARVKEVVDYAVDLGMYIMLDTHHETDYWLKTETSNEAALTEELCAIWKQIAETFKDYDDKLMFEGMNEPRLKGSAKEWNGGTKEERALINNLNQAFIDTVRATGGNNETRILVICTYGHCAEEQALKDLVIPDDENIVVAVHMYTPYFFTYIAQGSYSKWDGSHKSEINNIVKNLKKYFLDKNIPVIITETGAQYKDNTDDIVKWIHDYFGIMDDAEIKCFVWDNGIFNGGGEKFGVINRYTKHWNDQDIADAYTNR